MRFQVHATDTATAYQALLSRRVDLAIVHAIDMPDRKLMDVEELLQDPHVVVAGAHHPIVRRRSLSLGQLVDEPWVLPLPEQPYGTVVAEAFRALAAENPNFHGVLLGDGDMLPSVRQIAGDEPRLHLLGAISFADLPQYYAAADVFTLPSVGEGSISLAVLEAAAAGLPLVLTDDSSGQSAVFEPGRNGERVALGDAPDLARGLRAALAQRAAYGARSRELVEQHFSWDACAKQTVACYEAVARERRG